MTQISQNFDHFFINYKVERLQEETETRTQGAEIFSFLSQKLIFRFHIHFQRFY